MKEDEKPTFFFSHARDDRVNSPTRSPYLDQFFDDLEKALASYSAIAISEERLGTIDRRDVSPGNDWDDMLSMSLRTSHAFVAIFTPLFFKRENVGKELSIFLSRSPNLRLDSHGTLKGIQNILPIQWLSGWSYDNNEKRGRIAKILRQLNDVPSNPGTDPDFLAAITLYQLRGMQGCVANQPHYSLLLEAFARCIMSMETLPPAELGSFDTAENAFTCDWHAKLGGAAALSAAAAADEAPVKAPLITPQPLTSLVVFHITKELPPQETQSITFADRLIEQDDVPVDFADVMADIRAAAGESALSVLHAADAKGIPENSVSILARLNGLCSKSVITALLLSVDLWNRSEGPPDVIDEIINSTEWIGPVFVMGASSGTAAGRTASTRTILMLPSESILRRSVLNTAISDARGAALSAGKQVAANTDRLPILGGVSGNGQ